MSLAKKFIRYAVPSVVAMWVFCIYTMVDGMFVARGVGEMALAGVNIAMPFINLLFGLSLWLSVGTSTLIAIARGKGDHQEANRIFTVNFVVLAGISLLLTVGSLVFLDPIVTFLGATEQTASYVTSYLKIIIVFSGFYILSYSLEVLVKTDGYPTFATLCMCAGAVTNIILDYLFVIRWNMGVEGAAIATGISQLLSFALFIWHFLSKRSNIRFQKCRLDFSIYKKILPLGFSDCITEVSTGITVFIFNNVIIRLIGNNGVVVYSIISYLYNIVLMTMVGISQGMQPLVSFAHGQNSPKTKRTLFRYGIVGTAICAVAVFFLVNFIRPLLVNIFMPHADSALEQYAISAIGLFGYSFLIMGFNVVSSGYLTATEQPKYSFTISILRGLLLIPVGIIIAISIGGKDFLWTGAVFSELICLVATFIIMKKQLAPSEKNA